MSGLLCALLLALVIYNPPRSKSERQADRDWFNQFMD
jgi:hypothetical protein